MIGHALFCSEMNWIEKRWSREQHLSKDAPEIWQAVTVAVENSCTSFMQHYSALSGVTFKQQNGHRILVTVTRKYVPTGISSYQSEVPVQLIYEQGENQINVVIGYNKNPKKFEIKSDEEHAFIFYGGKEISPDELSRLVLEDIFFKIEDLNTSNSHSIGAPPSWMS